MKVGIRAVGARLRIVREPDVAIGPGKADILENIRLTGSILAAGRRMGMSYKRAWRLVEAMNRAFKIPLAATARGGRGHGGATPTEAGEEVLACYRRMERLTRDAVGVELTALRRLMADGPRGG